MPNEFNVKLAGPPMHVEVEPGGTIILRGAYRSTLDGSTIDAATTSWPDGAPGGSSVDAGGLIDLSKSGFHLESRDPVKHEVRLVATGEEGAACTQAGVASPCLPLRLNTLAQSRLLTADELSKALKGQITVEVLNPTPAEAAIDTATSPIALGALGLVGTACVVGLLFTWRRRQSRSAEGQLKALVARIKAKLRDGDAALSSTLAPVLGRTLETLRVRRIDPHSREGARIKEVLTRVEARLDASMTEERAAKEQAAADELVVEMEHALEAAEEARRAIQ